jgi:hypothetical protein
MRGYLLPRKVVPAAGEGSEGHAWGRAPARRRRESPGLPCLAPAEVEAEEEETQANQIDMGRRRVGLFTSVFGLCLPLIGQAATTRHFKLKRDVK